MNLAEAFTRWIENNTPRTHATLVSEMRAMSHALESSGRREHWHESLGVTCHDEMITILNALRGDHEYGLAAA